MLHVSPPAATTGTPGVAGFMKVVQRWRWMLLAATLAAGVAGYIGAARGAARYEARAVLLVGPLNVSKETLAAGQLSLTYAELARTQAVLDATARRLRLEQIGPNVEASASAATRLLTIRVRDSNPVRAARIANAEAAELIRATEQPRRAGNAGASTLRIVDAARPSSAPTDPAPVAIAILSALVGLLTAVGLAVVVDRSGDTVKGPEDLEAATGVPCIGMLSRAALRRPRQGTPMVALEPHSRAADEYRLLAAKLAARGRQSLLVMSLDGDSGVMAGNLAVALTATGSHVALLDVGTPAAAERARQGTESDADDLDAPIPVNGHKPNGHGPAHDGIEVLPPVALAEARRAGPDGTRKLLERLEAEADVVLLYAPGPQRSPSGLAWARAADSTLLVAARDRTLSGDLRAAAETLQLVHARLLGTVLADPPPAALRR
jgi:capsular polysaccharide biosynthesis protein/Mrp family chromosome partitioning ATPase